MALDNPLQAVVDIEHGLWTPRIAVGPQRARVRRLLVQRLEDAVGRPGLRCLCEQAILVSHRPARCRRGPPGTLAAQ